MSQVEFTDTVSRSGVLKIPTLLGGHICGSPKGKVLCCSMGNRVTALSFFQEATVSMNTYLDMVKLYAVRQIELLQPHIFLQQDRASPHWGLPVGTYLGYKFQGRWISRESPPD